MKLWQSVLIAALAVPTAYALWHMPDTGITAILIGALAAWLGRAVYRSKLARNPLGENRSYSLHPVVAAAAKCIGSFAAALLWAVSTTYAVRRGYVADAWFGAGVLLAPALVLLVVAVIYLIKAAVAFHYGGKSPGG